MTLITAESIHRSIEKIDNLNDDGLEKLSETYGLAHQDFFTYVLAAGVEYENDQLTGLLIYYYNILLESFAQQQVRLSTITDQMIEDFQEGYMEVLEEYMETEDHDLILSITNQPVLVEFMSNELDQADDDGTTLDDETATQLFIVSMAMIGLMNKAIVA